MSSDAVLIRLLGVGTRWWSNTDLSGWKPVTQFVMDGIVVRAAVSSSRCSYMTKNDHSAAPKTDDAQPPP